MQIIKLGEMGNSKFVPHVRTSTIFCKMSKRNCLGLVEKLPNRIHQEQLYRDKCQFVSKGDDQRSWNLPILGSTVSRFPTRMNTRTMSFQICWMWTWTWNPHLYQSWSYPDLSREICSAQKSALRSSWWCPQALQMSLAQLFPVQKLSPQVHTIVLFYPSLIFCSSSVHKETDDQQQPWRATNWMGSMLKPCMHTQTVWPEGHKEREREREMINACQRTWWIELVSMSQNLGNLSWPLESKICCSIWVHLSETHFNNPSKFLTLLLTLTWVDIRYTHPSSKFVVAYESHVQTAQISYWKKKVCTILWLVGCLHPLPPWLLPLPLPLQEAEVKEVSRC